MKILTSLIFTFLLIYTNFAQNSDDQYYVYAENGLDLKTLPSIESSVILEIPFGSEVKIIEKNVNSKEVTIDSLKGKYILLKYADTSGYAFSGYISRIIPPKLTNSWVELKDYLVEKFGESKEMTSLQEPNPQDSSDLKSGIKYSDNIEYYNFGEECSTNERMVMKNITINEAFLFITTFNAQYRNIKIDSPAMYVEAFNSYRSEQSLQNNQYDRVLTYKKDINNNFTYIEICFDTEAGSGCARIMKGKTIDSVIIEFSYSCN